jgi:putative aminopeptidase FrvX
MHSPNQIVSMGDVEQAAELIAGFIRALETDTSFVPI